MALRKLAMKARHRRAAHRLFLLAARTNAALFAEEAKTAPLIALTQRMQQLAYGHYTLEQMGVRFFVPPTSSRQAKMLIQVDRRQLPGLVHQWNPHHFLLSTLR
jgi:hypothetical protein